MAKWGTRPPLTPSQQYVFLRANPICAGVGQITPTGLSWEYKVRPTALSREYLIRIAFERDLVPSVFVCEPDIEILAKDRKVPHVYRNPLSLCLYLPRAKEWGGWMRIDQTFVPWTAVWLYYFEEWLESDDWKGGGEHPVEGDTPATTRIAS